MITANPCSNHDINKKNVASLGAAFFYRILTFNTLIVVLSLACTSCATSRYADPLIVMRNREYDLHLRSRAARQAMAEIKNDREHVDTLVWLLFSDYQPVELRLLAVDHLMQIDHSLLRVTVRDRITEIDDQTTFRYISQIAVKNDWTDFTAAVIRHWAADHDHIADPGRPEPAILQQLHPHQSPTEILVDVFNNIDRQWSHKAQQASWRVLCHTKTRSELVSILNASSSSSILVIYLQQAWRDLKVLPSTTESLLQLLTFLRTSDGQTFWQNASVAVSKLTDEQSQSLALRHLPVLIALNVNQLTLTREQLQAVITSRLENTRFFFRYTPVSDSRQNQLAAIRKTLATLPWADLATINLLQQAIADPNIIDQWFIQADEDRANPQTELGGALTYSPHDTFNAIAIHPVKSTADSQYHISFEMFEKLYTSLAHYHFHAQDYDNADLAGPGYGDRQLATRLPFNYLIITFIDRNTLNVDCHIPNGTTIDLGLIQRPSPINAQKTP